MHYLTWIVEIWLISSNNKHILQCFMQLEIDTVIYSEWL